jgi:hypothetical protein
VLLRRLLLLPGLLPAAVQTLQHCYRRRRC